MIKIETTKKVNSGGVQVYFINKVEALKREELPAMYKNSYPYAALTSNSQFTNRIEIRSNNSCDCIVEGKSLSVKDFEEMIETLKICGTRLTEVNRVLAQMRCNWAGKKNFEI